MAIATAEGGKREGRGRRRARGNCLEPKYENGTPTPPRATAESCSLSERRRERERDAIIILANFSD